MAQLNMTRKRKRPLILAISPMFVWIFAGTQVNAQGPELSPQSNAQRRQIIEAMDKGDGETVCNLAKANPELFNAKSHVDGNTPLHWAAAVGNKGVAALLLANGADANLKANNGFSPLHVAAGKGHEDVVELMLVNGADINAKDNDGMTPLHWATTYGHQDIVEFLLTKRADVNAKENDGATPLHFAAREGRKDIAELLVAKGADVNAKENTGATPLHWAAWKGQKDVAELLVANGADVNTTTHQGLTPLSLATLVHQDDFANWLRSQKRQVPAPAAKQLTNESPLSVTTNPAGPLLIRQAVYGDISGNSNIDVTDKVRAMVKNGSLRVAATGNDFGDLYNGAMKLIITKAELPNSSLNIGSAFTDIIAGEVKNNGLMTISGFGKVIVYYKYGNEGRTRSTTSKEDGTLIIRPPTELRVDYSLNGEDASKTVDLSAEVLEIEVPSSIRKN